MGHRRPQPSAVTKSCWRGVEAPLPWQWGFFDWTLILLSGKKSLAHRSLKLQAPGSGRLSCPVSSMATHEVGFEENVLLVSYTA